MAQENVCFKEFDRIVMELARLQLQIGARQYQGSY
jgi:hypothetical protein